MIGGLPLKHGVKKKIDTFIREFHKNNGVVPKKVGISKNAFIPHASGIPGDRTLVIHYGGSKISIVSVDGLSKESMIANN